jgi:peptide/nickel transport system substrate-binding protein
VASVHTHEAPWGSDERANATAWQRRRERFVNDKRSPEQIAASWRRLNRRDLLRWASAASLGLPAAGHVGDAVAGVAPRLRTNAANRILADNGTPGPVPGRAGGSFVFARRNDSVSFDPIYTEENFDIWVFLNTYDQLVRVSNDGTTIEPALAQSWDVSQDGLTYTFHLRPGVRFSDGTPLKASDVKYSINRAATTAKSIWTFTLTALKDIATPDDATVVMTLKQPWAPFLSDIAMFNSSIISEAFATKVGEDKLVEQTMGTGPFVLQDWKRGESVTLAKNPNYWEAGFPYLDTITVTVVPDDNTRILQLQGGDIDGMSDVPFNRVPDLAQDANLAVERFPSTAISFVILNIRKAPLNDVKVRQALNYATDKQTLIKNLLFGNGEVSNSFMPNGTLYWNKDQAGYPFDLAQATQSMAQSSIPQGGKIGMMVNGSAETDQQVATALKSMWAKINVELDIQPLDAAVLHDNEMKNAFDTLLWTWTNDIIDPDELVSIAIIPDSDENFHTGWTNQQAIALAKQAQATLDDAQRRAMYYQIQALHLQDAPFVYLYVTPNIDVVKSTVHDFVQHAMGQWVWEKTWIEH